MRLRLLNGLSIVIICLLSLWILKWILILMYCQWKRKRDGINSKKIIQKSDGITKKSKIKSNINNYLYGLVRWESIHVGRFPSMHIRKFVYKYLFAMELQKETVIYGGCELRSPWKIQLGKCVIGVSNVLDGRHGICIEDGVCLGSNVFIWTEQHDLNDKFFRCNDKGGKVVIKKHAWICSRSTILPKTIIGEGAVVACGAIVSHDCDDFGVYCGIPAKKTKDRRTDLEYQVCDEYWHFY